MLDIKYFILGTVFITHTLYAPWVIYVGRQTIWRGRFVQRITNLWAFKLRQYKWTKVSLPWEVQNAERLFSIILSIKCNITYRGGSPGLVVIGGDSCFEGCGFESQYHILDGNFFTLICCKIYNDVCLKRPKK